nr:hypothetical protein Muribac2_480 [uncultured Muribaculaceae bacterium]
MKNKVLILLLSIVFAHLCGFAADTLEAADSAYNAKNYEGAISLYTKVMDDEGTSPQLLFNLGNACFQTGDYGHAMLYWLRARRLDPGQKEINANINYLKSRVQDANKAEQHGKRMKVTPDETSFFQNVHSSIASDTSSNAWAVWAAVTFIFFIASLAVYIFTRNVMARKFGFFGGIVFILCSVVFLIFSFMASKSLEAHDQGVVTAFKVTLLTEPGKQTDSDKGGVLTKGTVVQILSEEVDAEGTVTWFKVRLNSDYIGWVSASDMAVV